MCYIMGTTCKPTFTQLKNIRVYVTVVSITIIVFREIFKGFLVI
jgi:hypothetical protein